MWILDVGRLNTMDTADIVNGPPKLVIWDMATNTLDRTFVFANDVGPYDASDLQDLVVVRYCCCWCTHNSVAPHLDVGAPWLRQHVCWMLWLFVIPGRTKSTDLRTLRTPPAPMVAPWWYTPTPPTRRGVGTMLPWQPRPATRSPLMARPRLAPPPLTALPCRRIAKRCTTRRSCPTACTRCRRKLCAAPQPPVQHEALRYCGCDAAWWLWMCGCDCGCGYVAVAVVVWLWMCACMVVWL